MCRYLRSKSKRNDKCVLVFENLEHALIKQDIVQKLRSFLLSLDDENLAPHNVQIVLVGVPSDIKLILTDQNRYQTIANRVTEISEISRMSRAQSRALISQGFIQELGMEVQSPQYCASQIIYLTDRIPQYLQDLCLQVAFVAEDNQHIIDPVVVVDGAHNWVDTNARQSREFVEQNLGAASRRFDQKSRIILAVAKCKTTTFFSEDIEKILREEFPQRIGDRKIQVTRYLNQLTKGNQRLLRKQFNGQKFHLVSPKIRSVLRHCVRKSKTDEAVLFITNSENEE